LRNKRLNVYISFITDETNGGKAMEKSQKINAKAGLGLLMVAFLVLAAFSTQAWAVVDCTNLPNNVVDSDGDGFSDALECSGIELYSGVVVNTSPDVRDLFVILVPANPSNFPPNPLEFVSNPVAAGGLGVVTHEIPLVHPERLVSPDSQQKAVRITEDLHPEGIILGYANQGTPNGLDEAIIYTEHIESHVRTVCEQEGSDSCTDVSGAVGPDEIIALYIKHTIAHEIGHMTMLAVEYNRRFGGYHYKAGSEVVLEQAVKYTAKKDKVTFYISTHYAEPDQLGLQLQ
jgi:hypothetical protein